MQQDQFVYYVYAYLREDGTPYYIGKGKGNRALKKHQHYIAMPPVERIVFCETGLSNIGAIAIERRLIRWYGRKDIFTGILHNRTDGGDGRTNSSQSPSTRKRISQSMLGIPKTKQHKEKIAKANQSQAKRKASSNFNKLNGIRPPSALGKKRSEQTRKKMSESAKRREQRKKMKV